MKKYCIFILAFLYLEIFSRQATGENIIQYDCGESESLTSVEESYDAFVEKYEDICSILALRPENLTEKSLRNLSNNFNVTTGDYIQLYNYTTELVVTQVSANTTTEIIHYGYYRNTIQISEDSCEERKTFVWRIPYSNTAYYNNSTFIVISDVITVYTSSINSVSNLTIVFSGYYLQGGYKCVHLTPEGYWSTEGVETSIDISNQTVQCTTKIQNIRTIALGRGYATGLKYIQYHCEYSYPWCLYISDVKVNWETANSICTMQGGRLFNPIRDLIGYNGIPSNTGGKYYWTEFHRARDTEQFQTTDGYNISDDYYDSYYWKYNHPIDGIDCVGFDEESNEILSLACNTTHLAVCWIDFATCDALVEEYKVACSSVALRPEMLTENILRNLYSNFNVATGDYIRLYNYPNELVVTQVSANTTTEITHYWDTIQISEDPYEARKTFVWRIPNYDREYYGNNTFIVISDVITVYTSSIGYVEDLTIVFSEYYVAEEDNCVHLTPEGYWSTEEVETEFISNETVQCTTQIKNIRTMAVGRGYATGTNIIQYDCGKSYDALAEYEDACSSLALRPENLTENTLRDLSSNFNLTTGDYIKLYNSSNELVVTQVSANTTTEITLNGNTIQISEDPYEARKTFVWITQAYYDNSTFRVGYYIFTVYTSSISSVANLTIEFSAYYITGRDECVHLTPEGYWSTEGVDTEIISEISIKCTTQIQNTRTIALGVRNSEGIILSLAIAFTIISVFTALFLLSSVVIFIASGKRFFSHDINVLHFNNTLSLLLAIIMLPLIIIGPFCILTEVLPRFLWTNVFLSSLSIAIVVFYTIWVVSIKHTARKLSIFLIPIGWGLSLLWAVAWTIFHSLKGDSSLSTIFYKTSVKFQIPWSSFVPMIVILLINATLLILSLFKVWLVLRKQSSQQGELKRLRKVVIGGILLVPALGLPFISLIAIQLYASLGGINEYKTNTLTLLIIILINSPIGIIHFISITCQIRETIIHKYCCCCCRRITPAQIAHSLHLNIVRPRPKQKNHQTVIENSTIQQTPEDTIPDSVPSNDSAVYSNDSTQAVIYHS